MAVLPIYQRQIDEQALPSPRMTGHSAEAYGSTVYGQTGQLAAALQAKVNEFDDAETMEAINGFRREMDEYHTDPKNGILNLRQGKNAIGVSDMSLGHMTERAAEFRGKLRSPRAQQNFDRMAAQYINSRHTSNMQFETKNVDSYELGEANANIEYNLKYIQSNWDNDDVFAQGMAGIEQSLYFRANKEGWGKEKFAQERAKLQDTAAAMRFASMFDKRPDIARDWYRSKGRDLFSPAMREKIEDALDGYEARVIAENTLSMFDGRYDEYQGESYIRSLGLRPELEDKAVSMFSSRWGARARGFALQEAELEKRRKEVEDGFYRGAANGDPPDEDTIRGSILGGARQLFWLNYLDKYTALQEYEAKVAQSSLMGGASEEEKSRARMDSRGITTEQHANAMRELNDLASSATPDQFKTAAGMALSSGLILKSEHDSLVLANKNLQNKTKKQASDAMEADIKWFTKTFTSAKLQHKPFYANALNELYNAKSAILNNLDDNQDWRTAPEQFREQIRGVLRDIVDSGALTSSRQEKALTEAWQFLDADATLTTPPISRTPTGEYIPKGERRAKYWKTLAKELVGIERTPTSANLNDFTAPRMRGTKQGQHNGFDFAAPEGTPIRMPQVFELTDMVVEENIANSKTGGNMIVIVGRDTAGNPTKLKFHHMRDQSALKVGDKVFAGSLIGYVGHTGTTSRNLAAGKTGDHLDIKMQKYYKGKWHAVDMLEHIDVNDARRYDREQMFKANDDTETTLSGDELFMRFMSKFIGDGAPQIDTTSPEDAQAALIRYLQTGY